MPHRWVEQASGRLFGSVPVCGTETCTGGSGTATQVWLGVQLSIRSLGPPPLALPGSPAAAARPGEKRQPVPRRPACSSCRAVHVACRACRIEACDRGRRPSGTGLTLSRAAPVVVPESAAEDKVVPNPSPALPEAVAPERPPADSPRRQEDAKAIALLQVALPTPVFLRHALAWFCVVLTYCWGGSHRSCVRSSGKASARFVVWPSSGSKRRRRHGTTQPRACEK